MKRRTLNVEEEPNNPEKYEIDDIEQKKLKIIEDLNVQNPITLQRFDFSKAYF